MKRKILFVSILYMLGTMAGCVEAIDLNETQMDQVVGYSVYSVLAHDKNYMVGLNEVETPTQEEDADNDVTQPPSQDTGNDNNSTDNDKPNVEKPSGGNTSIENPSVVTTTMEKALDVDGVSITYTGVTVGDVYPEVSDTPAFVLKAFTGNKLVVLKFDVTNKTSKDINLDIASKNLTIKGTFNKSIKTIAQVTLLPEALNKFKETIPAGKTVQTVLVFEMTEANANNLTSILLEVKSSKGTNSVNIK